MKLAHQIGLAVGIRIALAPFFAHPYDVYQWFTQAQSVYDGQTSIQTLAVPYSYSLILFALPGYLAYHLVTTVLPSFTFPISALPSVLNPGAIWNISLVPGVWFDLFFKLPLIASDIITGYLIYSIVLKSTEDRRLAEISSFSWLLNPLVIWVSSGWGMDDTLPILFTVICLYAIVNGRPTTAGISLAIAVALKVYPLIVLVPIALVINRRHLAHGVLSYLVGFVLTLGLMLTPSFARSASLFASMALNFNTGLSQLPSYFGLTFWNVFSLGLGIQPNRIYLLSFQAALLLATYAYLANRTSGNDLADICVGAAMSIIAVLVLYPYVGENFPLWFIPFLSISFGVLPIARKEFWILSGVSVLFSITDSLLPYFLLPVAPWIGGQLASLLSLASPYRIVSGGAFHPGLGVGSLVLISLGLLAWLLMLATFVKLARAPLVGIGFS